jgi:hypothetical protein
MSDENERPSLRNYFAAHALEGLLAGDSISSTERSGGFIADKAFQLADAMLARTHEYKREKADIAQADKLQSQIREAGKVGRETFYADQPPHWWEPPKTDA